jgi:hypothetical protein
VSYTDKRFYQFGAATFVQTGMGQDGQPYGIIQHTDSKFYLVRPKTGGYLEISSCELPFSPAYRPSAYPQNISVGNGYLWIVWSSVGSDNNHLGLTCINTATMTVVSSNEALTSLDIFDSQFKCQYSDGSNFYTPRTDTDGPWRKYGTDCSKTDATSAEVAAAKCLMLANDGTDYFESRGLDNMVRIVLLSSGDPNEVTGTINVYPNHWGCVFAVDASYIWGILLDGYSPGYFGQVNAGARTWSGIVDYTTEISAGVVSLAAYSSWGTGTMVAPARLYNGQFIMCVTGYNTCGWVVLDSSLKLVHRLLAAVKPIQSNAIWYMGV